MPGENFPLQSMIMDSTSTPYKNNLSLELLKNSLGYKQQIVEKIKKDAGGKVVDINYDMDLAWSVGYDYLIEYYKINKSKEVNHEITYWISYPKKTISRKARSYFWRYRFRITKNIQKDTIRS